VNAIAWRVAGALLALLLAGAGGWYIYALRADLHTAQDERDDAQQATLDRDTVIKGLQDTAKRNEAARAKLETSQAGIRSTLTDRETLIRNLQNENAELRTWATGPVPAAVVRLREHEAITGAAAYREYVSRSSALQSAGSQNGQ
jgi:LysB family phage lysis regulatory protein